MRILGTTCRVPAFLLLDPEERRLLRAALRHEGTGREAVLGRAAAGRRRAVLWLLESGDEWPEGRADACAEPDGEGPRLEERYALGPLLGRGAGGRVHAARDRRGARTVAVKLGRRGGASVGREIRILRRLRIAGVVRLLAWGATDGRTWMATERVQGGPFPGEATGRALGRRFATLVGVVSRMHARGVVHGDLKPANVLVSAEGAVTVIDFGAATGPGEEGVPAGTPAFLSPARLRGAASSVASDLYALGALLYLALTGALPHGEGGESTLVERRLRGPPLPVRAVAPRAPRDLAAVADRLLRPDAPGRFASAPDLLSALPSRRRRSRGRSSRIARAGRTASWSTRTDPSRAARRSEPA